jgi:hypothetical protein
VKFDEFSIRLDRTYYHLHEEIFKLCRSMFGDCSLYDDLDEGKLWARSMMFGYTTIKFRNESDLDRFKDAILSLG